MRFPTLPALAALLLLSACDPRSSPPPPAEPKVSITDAWVRLPAVRGRPGSGYFTATSTTIPEAITGVTSPAPGRVEMHESMAMAGGMTSMRAMESAPFTTGETLRFAPGGKHLMLFSLDPTVNPGDTLALAFRFAEAPPLTVRAKVIGAGDPAPE